jgi:cytochrome c oxidase subunit 2
MNLSILPDQASSVASEVDRLTWWLIGMSTFFTVLIALLIVLFAVRYRRRDPESVGSRFDNSAPLEIAWTLIPLLLVLFTFGWGAKVYFDLYKPPSDAATFYVTGKQWMWKIQHPTGQREINELRVPLGQTVRLLMTSEDVIHSFYVPAFRTKADVLPGRYTSIWFRPTRTGRYHLFCTEYCGAEHSRMIGTVHVLEPEEYQRWLASVPVPVLPAVGGEELFAGLGCANCHRAESDARGPSLAGLYGREVELVGGGRVRADESYLRESILSPGRRVVAGYQPVMPSYRGQISEEEMIALIEYIKSLEVSSPRVASVEQGVRP